MDIALYSIRLVRPFSDDEVEKLLQFVPEERRQRLKNLKNPVLGHEPICAYFALLRGLNELYGWREIPPLVYNKYGKPEFADHPDVHFNISHTTGAVLVGVSDQPIGVDIERVRPVSQRAMRRLADVSTERAFFQNWVRREARTKRSGNGIGTMMRSETSLQQGEFYYELDTFPGYVAGVATRDRTPLGPLRKYSLDELF